MTVAEATDLYSIKDLDASKKNQANLGEKVHRSWDQAEAQKVPFTVQARMKIGRAHWNSVKQNKITLSRTTPGNNGISLVVTGDSGTGTKKKKNNKKKKKGVDPKSQTDESLNAALKPIDKKEPSKQHPKDQPNPTYCFC